MEKVRELMRMLRFFLKAFPAFLLATQVLVPCYDWFRPWPSAVEQLSGAGVVLRFCVGISSMTMIQGGDSSTQHSRSFLVVVGNSVLPRLMTVDRDNASAAATLDDSGPAWVLVWLGVIALCILLTWRWWVRPWRLSGFEGLRLAI
jgi:hypothetical protein